ncbi:hypothetical protein [Mucilaginibacter gotjawali]|uniref:Uncharacterized protein n=2 Tax=Mucilaginibacter gotjawali TaxID=1550579 RepID=A0A839SCP9_9SPHI|nr:hypothetical protein [Mucilaginibacter gotjawali]MBB3055961.1 hypothetical protein [Mucilaginibacter gotjawali]BAU54787.1 hypothetical protein MgSA37_02965 [Mucilaginibacter gotjawali]
MNNRAIDYITEDFYESLSFMDGEMPDLDTVRDLFFEDGALFNLSFGKPITYTVESFTRSIEDSIEDGQLTQFMQRELYSKTEIFGRVAQRVSVYEYSFAYYEIDNLPRGVNYIQFIQVDDLWRITSMAWNDESANYRVPVDLMNS